MSPQMGEHLYDYVGGTRPDVLKWYLYVAERIKEGSNTGLKKLLEDHNTLIEQRTEWKTCQKTGRRRRIIAFWLSDAGLTMKDLKERCP